MEHLCNLIVKDVFGSNCNLLLCEKISEGLKNSTFKLICSEYHKPLFLKVERLINIPRIQIFQIKREVAGITLCKSIGIPVPTIIKSDEDGRVDKAPWILEEFIDEKLICEYSLDDHNKEILGKEFESVYSKISSIKSNYYGDTFSTGYIGQHSTWNETMSQITKLLFEDCIEINVFEDNATIVNLALNKALSNIKSNLQSVLYHYDLFSSNIMGYKNDDGEVHIGHIIDFGMSLFAPISFSQYQTRKLTDFITAPIDINKIYGIKNEELIAYDILRFEPILLINIMKYDDYKKQTLEYVDKCNQYLSN